MMIIFQVLLIVHVMASMVWLGGATFAPRRVRRALEAGREHARLEMAEVRRMGVLMHISAVLTLLTGIAMVLTTPGGFGDIGVRFHIALTLALIWVLIGATVSRATIVKIKTIADGDEALDGVKALVSRLILSVSAEKLLFTAILVLMLWRL